MSEVVLKYDKKMIPWLVNNCKSNYYHDFSYSGFWRTKELFYVLFKDDDEAAAFYDKFKD